MRDVNQIKTNYCCGTRGHSPFCQFREIGNRPAQEKAWRPGEKPAGSPDVR